MKLISINYFISLNLIFLFHSISFRIPSYINTISMAEWKITFFHRIIIFVRVFLLHWTCVKSFFAEGTRKECSEVFCLPPGGNVPAKSKRKTLTWLVSCTYAYAKRRIYVDMTQSLRSERFSRACESARRWWLKEETIQLAGKTKWEKLCWIIHRNSKNYIRWNV